MPNRSLDHPADHPTSDLTGLLIEVRATYGERLSNVNRFVGLEMRLIWDWCHMPGSSLLKSWGLGIILTSAMEGGSPQCRIPTRGS